MTTSGPVSVLVIDDSAHNRRAITQMLETAEGVEVLDRASDGEEGLKKAAQLRPDVITLDLEMPKLDGFAFLRLLMATVPTPVIVISSYAHKADVFKALELGAFDFIAKPPRGSKDGIETLRAELLDKLHAVRLIRPAPKKRPGKDDGLPAAAALGSTFVVAIGASTGGPPAIQAILEAMSEDPRACLLISQHMPAKFTEAFADRLDKLGTFTVKEAKEGDRVAAGHAFIAPGGRHLELVQRAGRLELRTPLPKPGEKHAPAVNRMFQSVAEALGRRAFGVVLTGMGSDGAEGAKAIRAAGGEVWAESEETAVIDGMPKEAIATGAVTRVLPLPEIGPALLMLGKKRRG